MKSAEMRIESMRQKRLIVLVLSLSLPSHAENASRVKF